MFTSSTYGALFIVSLFVSRSLSAPAAYSPYPSLPLESAIPIPTSVGTVGANAANTTSTDPGSLGNYPDYIIHGRSGIPDLTLRFGGYQMTTPDVASSRVQSVLARAILDLSNHNPFDVIPALGYRWIDRVNPEIVFSYNNEMRSRDNIFGTAARVVEGYQTWTNQRRRFVPTTVLVLEDGKGIAAFAITISPSTVLPIAAS